ncbi:MAG TPA: flagellar biosynthesis anti-sigma factor FlgM [Steroidobacteraceae bacterium]|nr:flagellar biosynthesis anti-sigma factor FlgM [Steroidobacteraceae bacterium]HRX89221.1 flagellar biosynthesis anti-sigma factor FlgM [Steroidobacteraceae bacterium]
MSSKIGALDQRPSPVTASVPAPRVRDSLTDTAAGGRAPDEVSITETARHMATLEKALAGLPAINDFRVAAVRRAIDEGRYHVDADKIAVKLLASDRDLAAAQPKAK